MGASLNFWTIKASSSHSVNRFLTTATGVFFFCTQGSIAQQDVCTDIFEANALSHQILEKNSMVRKIKLVALIPSLQGSKNGLLKVLKSIFQFCSTECGDTEF